MDPIFKAATGGRIFVGGERAANDLGLLKDHGVTHVVNCTDNIKNFFEGRGMTYLKFNVSFWSRSVRDSKSCADFLRPMISFVEAALERGESVLVHCLAGAHRAGTTGCILLMHFAGMPMEGAVRTAQTLRPVIQPIGSFPQLLGHVSAVPRLEDGRLAVV